MSDQQVKERFKLNLSRKQYQGYRQQSIERH